MIYLGVILYLIIGIFISTFFAVYKENKNGKPWHSTYMLTLATVLLCVAWPIVLLAIPFAIIYWTIRLVAKAASWSANEVFNPRENV